MCRALCSLRSRGMAGPSRGSCENRILLVIDFVDMRALNAKKSYHVMNVTQVFMSGWWRSKALNQTLEKLLSSCEPALSFCQCGNVEVFGQRLFQDHRCQTCVFEVDLLRADEVELWPQPISSLASLSLSRRSTKKPDLRRNNSWI